MSLKLLCHKKCLAGMITGADPGFFLGGGAPLRNGVTNTNKSHFLAEYQLYKKTVGHLRGGGAHPLHPPPRSAPVLAERIRVGDRRCPCERKTV